MLKPSKLHRLKASVAAFRRSEDGILTIFGVGIFILMMLAGGVALDFMRFESERARLQNTLDRATLAAASLSQQGDQQQVINDYFRAAGLAGYDVEITVDETIVARTVRAETSAPVRSLFLNMLGVDSITAPASSGATERIMNLEISLILDVSGSMGGDKIARLREAAGDFVQDMVDTPPPGQPRRVSISIVPYNGKVNIGSTMANYFNLDPSEHSLSNCVRFSAADFQSTGIAAGTVLTRIADFDTRTDDLDEVTGGLASPHCPHDDTNQIIPLSNDADALEAYIDSLNAGGWTAIDVGMKWGVALLDPAARSRVATMTDDNLVIGDFDGRPLDYGADGSLKIAVVMTDGANTNQQDLRSNKRGNALSPIYAYNPLFTGSGGTRNSIINETIRNDESTTRYSVWFPSMSTYYDWARDDRRSSPVGGSDAVQLTWQEANSIFAVDYLQDQIVWWQGTRTWPGGSRYRNSGYAQGAYIPDDDYYFWRQDTDYTFAGQSTADSNLSTICAAARNQGIVIYSIAFQAGSGGEAAMRDCAHADSFYFNVEGLNIAQAFDSIEASINSLKLIQ